MNTPTARFMVSPAAPRGGLAEQAATLAPWFHNLHLPDGGRTAPDHPLGDFPRFKWLQIAPALPADLTGWTALDIGCNAGFYSIELARRGARVVAIEHDLHFLNQARWAARVFELEERIELRHCDVYGLGRSHESFDLVLFMGVFYHLRHPLLALDLLAGRTRRLMVFQTFTIPGEEEYPVPSDQDFDERSPMLRADWPKMAFIEHSLAGDPTNWWAPNHAGVLAMLRSSGLNITACPAHEIYLCEPSPMNPDLQRVREELRAATINPTPTCPH
jgi:tRNA (mo5U34)-methyltransferase